MAAETSLSAENPLPVETEPKHLGTQTSKALPPLPLWRLALWLLAFWVLAAPGAAAQVRPAREPIVGSRLRHLLEDIPGSATDLPPYLMHAQDVYLFVTAGASYTEIDVLANPEVAPQTVAHALASALRGTPLRGRTVKWSADRYSAAQVSARSSRFGAMHGSSIVAIGPLMLGLRQAGLTPHLLLRVPHYAQASVPSPHYGTTNFRWYDAHHLGGQSSVTVQAQLSALTVCGLTAYCLLVPIAGLLGLWLAPFLSGRLSGEAARLQFRHVSAFFPIGALVVQMGGLIYLLRASGTAVLADLWFGSSSLAALVPFLAAGAAFLPLFLLLARKQELRRFGPLPVPATIPMSDEEKAARKRVAQWSALPHLVGPVALGVLPFFVPRTSPLYPYVHPVALFLPLLGTLLAAKVLQKSLDRFTQKTPDDDLTWRARQLGQPLGVRMPDVFVEDSSRAAHLAFASHQGQHITLSRKLLGTFTAAETDFVLAHHLACMKHRRGGNEKWLSRLLVLPIFAFALLLLSPRMLPGVPQLAAFVFSPWFFGAFLVYLGLILIVITVVAGSGIQRLAKQDAYADRDALEVTGDLAAAESVVAKIEMDPAVAVLLAGSRRDSALIAKRYASRLVLRQAALQKTAQTLHFAPAPGASPDAPSDISQYPSPDAGSQNTDRPAAR